MFQERYKKTIAERIENTELEIQSLTNDYHNATDDVVKSQVKTFLEKKQLLYLDLMERYNGSFR